MLGSLAKGYSFIALVRIGSRVFDFFLNILVIRAINPNLLASTVHFQLILNIALFYTKNCLRNTYQKRPETLSETQTIISASNLMLLGVPITLLLAISVVAIQLYLNNYTSTLQYFALTCVLYGMSGVLESLYETFICKLLLSFNYQRIAKIQILSLFFKSMVLWISVIFNLFQKYGVLMFGVSQLLYAIMLAFFGFMSMQSNHIMKRLPSGEYIAKEMKESAKLITVVTFMKLLMQEAQKIIMVIVNNVNMIGVFTLVNNLGSIIPRFVFQPLEQIAYNVFAKSKQNNPESKSTLETILRFQLVFGLILTIFGYLYSESLLQLLYGTKWVTTDSVHALQAFCLYIMLMGINGVCEAFVYARIEAQQLVSFQKSMMVGALVYLASGVISIYLGSEAAGLILSSCIGMLFRIYVCWKIHIKRIYQMSLTKWVRHLSVRKQVFVVYVVTFMGLYTIRNKYWPVVNLVIGGVFAGVNVLVTGILEKDTLVNIKNLAVQKQAKQL